MTVCQKAKESILQQAAPITAQMEAILKKIEEIDAKKVKINSARELFQIPA
jgi:hypothetical protein